MPSGVTPSESMLEEILNLPIPKILTDAKSWYGQVNQVAWVSSLGSVMLSFHNLIKQDSHFAWNQSFEAAFQHSKAKSP